MELVLIRGLPGSGKSTMARGMAGFEHFEADMFFLDAVGNYVFDKSKIKEAHWWCQRQAHSALSRGFNVVVSNTFTRAVEMEPYMKIADSLGIKPRIVEATGKWSNVHGVPEEAVERMRQRWEKIACDDHGFSGEMKKQNRIQVYIGQPLQRFLSTRPLKSDPASLMRAKHGVFDSAGGEEEISESTALNRLAERYEYLLSANFPELSDAAWRAVLDALNGRTEHAIAELYSVAGMVAGDVDFGGERKDAPEVIKELGALTKSEQLVVIEVAERFWGRKDQDYREVIKAVALKPRGS